MRILVILALLILGRMAPMQNCQSATDETQTVAVQSHDCCGEEKESKDAESSDCGTHCRNICSAPYLAAPTTTPQVMLAASVPAATPQLPIYSRELSVLDRPPIA